MQVLVLIIGAPGYPGKNGAPGVSYGGHGGGGGGGYGGGQQQGGGHRGGVSYAPVYAAAAPVYQSQVYRAPAVSSGGYGYGK